MLERKDSQDVVFIGPCNGDGSHAAIRYRDGKPPDSGTLRKMEHGRPIIGDPVRLHPRTDGPGMDVEYLIGRPDEPAESEGPAMVNSQAYRDNWSGIFDRRSLFGSEVRAGSA